MTETPLSLNKLLLRLENIADLQDASSSSQEDLQKLTQQVKLRKLAHTLKKQADLKDMALDESYTDFSYDIVEMSLSGMIPLSNLKKIKDSF